MGQQLPGTLDPSILSFLQGAAAAPPISPLMELAKLVAAAVAGLIITVTHRYTLKERTLSRSMLQASVLLAVAGALMMIIIGNSTARALGIAGGASIIRFRTPVDDPKDAILLFLLMGLGMSAGLGSFAVCALGTAFLCVFLLLLNQLGEGKPRTVILEVAASSSEFPMEHVGQVLRNEAESFEVIKMSDAKVHFSVKLRRSVSLTYIAGSLFGDGQAGVKSVSWDEKKADQ
jgi:Domain of unknown function (DUF4956)